MMLRLTDQWKAMIVAVVGALFFAVETPAADSMQIAQYLRDIQAGPSTFYTPEAYAYFVSRSSISLNSLSTDRDAASRCFSAITAVSRLPAADVTGAIPIIAMLFPRLVHLVQIRGAAFTGNEGNFDDCVGTYVTNAKNQFIVSPPILDYNFLSQYENFIDESHEIEFISKQLDASGQIIQATFNLTIFLYVYIGEGALSRLTGQTLGHDPNAWRQWTTGSIPSASRTAASYAIPAVVAAPPAQTVPVSPGFSQQIVPGRSYRISLTNGNTVEGKVLLGDNASVTLLAAEGKQYVIAVTLIKSCEPVAPPAQFVPGRSYRVSLTNGNTVEGKVLLSDNASVTLLAAEGKEYMIAVTLIKSCEPVGPPAQFVPGRSYRVSLSTGNDLEGKVLSRDDASVTLLTAEGKPYVISLTLIKSCEPVEPSASSLIKNP
jgi:hypothetical protein